VQNQLTDPGVVRRFGNNLHLCLSLIGSRLESLALRCHADLEVILGFSRGLGPLEEKFVSVICSDIGISRELILKEYQSTAEAVQCFEEVFRVRGLITASNLIGTETRGVEVMPSKLQLPPGKLNDPAWRKNFGINVRVCLHQMQMSAASLAVRIAIREDHVQRLLDGTLALTNDDVEAVLSEIGLNINDFSIDYEDGIRRRDQLSAKLKAAGRIKSPPTVAAVTPELASLPVPEVLAPVIEAEVLSKASAPEPVIPAPVITAAATQTMETEIMIDINTVTWSDDGVTGSAAGRTFNLRDKELRKKIAGNITALRKKLYSEDTIPEFFARIKKTSRNHGWLNNLNVGSATLERRDVETFAEFFGVSVLAFLAGEFNNAKQAEDGDVSKEVAATPAPAVASLPESTSQKSSTVASVAEGPTNGGASESLAAVEAAAEPPISLAERHVQRTAAIQECFKQRLLGSHFQLSRSPNDFLAATQVPTVDWCNIYLTMTVEGEETVEYIRRIAKRFDADDDHRMDILTHIISMTLGKQ
jgi:hypothetical protein